MATRLSPTANLLRKSRLFALPSALTPPTQPSSSHTVTESDTATLPYPVKAAIETIPSSLQRGDWGLKRPLPSKATTKSSSSPVIRINQVDTFEHVTDFDSAGDHIATLKKWQELNLPISTVFNTGVSVASGGGCHKSVFDSSFDNTGESQNHEAGKTSRYRFKGPWLAGLTETEFHNYLKTVRKQKPEFLLRLRQFIAETRAMERRRQVRFQGVKIEEEDVPRDLSDSEFESALMSLRDNPSALGPEINKFLDLAPPPTIPDQRIQLRNWRSGPSNISSPEYAKNGPPKTHPSAGLSYLRTNAHMYNHPVAGPQKNSRPVQARLLRSKRRTAAAEPLPMAIIGVGGIVADDIKSRAFGKVMGRKGASLDPETPGGPRYWTKPDRAAVNSSGKILLRVDSATNESKALYGVQEDTEPVPDYARGGRQTVPKLDSSPYR